MTNHEADNLIKRIAAGDMQALEILYRNMSKPVYFYALRLTGSPEAAEDVMQDTFISVLKGSGNYKEKGKGTSFIFTIAKNRATDWLRRNRNTVGLDDISGLPDDNTPVYFSESIITFMQMLSPLNKKERDIVIMRLLSDMTLTQISRELGIPKGTVFWTYNNAVKKLRKASEGGNLNEKQV